MGAAHPPEMAARIADLLADTLDTHVRYYRRCPLHHLPVSAGRVNFRGDVELRCPRGHAAHCWEVYDSQAESEDVAIIGEGSALGVTFLHLDLALILRALATLAARHKPAPSVTQRKYRAPIKRGFAELEMRHAV